MKNALVAALTVVATVSLARSVAAQAIKAPSQTSSVAPAASAADAASLVAAPVGYVIGPDDVLGIIFWREKDLSGDVVVRPDGRISVPLINEIIAAGLTPEQLREKLNTQAERYVQDPNVAVVVKQINSRRVFITGQVNKPGTYALSDRMTVVQLIALAGGLADYADKENIVVMRTEKRPDGSPWSFKVNYAQLMKRVNLLQNIELKPGDTIMVP